MRDEGKPFAPSGTAKPCACGHSVEQHHSKHLRRTAPVATNCWLCRCVLYEMAAA